MTTEPTKLSPGLIGFYACCASVSIGAAVTALVLVLFADRGFGAIAALGLVMMVGGSIGAWLSLRAARKE